MEESVREQEEMMRKMYEARYGKLSTENNGKPPKPGKKFKEDEDRSFPTEAGDVSNMGDLNREMADLLKSVQMLQERNQNKEQPLLDTIAQAKAQVQASELAQAQADAHLETLCHRNIPMEEIKEEIDDSDHSSQSHESENSDPDIADVE